MRLPDRTAADKARCEQFARERQARIRRYTPRSDLHFDCFCGAPAFVDIDAEQVQVPIGNGNYFVSGSIQLCRDCALLVGRRAAE